MSGCTNASGGCGRSTSTRASASTASNAACSSRSVSAAAWRKTKLQDGIAGTVHFDADGDIANAPVVVYRRRFGAPPITMPGMVTPHFVLDRVITPPRELVP
jgi:hypothetical protein